MNGADVKKLILDSGVKLWQVAVRWGLTDSNFSRRLRRPFNEKDVKRVKDIVAELITEQQTNTSK